MIGAGAGVISVVGWKIPRCPVFVKISLHAFCRTFPPDEFLAVFGLYLIVMS